MIDTNKVLNVVKNTPLKEMDDIKIMLDKSEAFGFVSWVALCNNGIGVRWYGRMVYQNTNGWDSVVINGQGVSNKGYASKENAFKYAMIDFEKTIKHIYL